MSRYKPDKSITDPDLLTNLQNLNYLDKKQKALFKSRSALTRELAYTICQGGKAAAEDIKEKYLSVFASASSKALDAEEKYSDLISIAERIEICKEISVLSDTQDIFYESILGASDVCSADAVKKIAYVKNNFTDSAYLAFSKASFAFRYAYFDSFDAICEDVHSGKSEFCILPIETSSDGKLFSFYSLIDRYEFRIVSTCTVKHQDGSKFTKFALLGRSVRLSEENNKKGKKLELRISQASTKGSPLYEILRAADACNIKLCKIDSIPLSYNDSMLSYYAVFDIYEAELKAFITYLALEHPQCYALGIYFEN